MSSLADKLRSSLGSAYTVDRELGGGGMSRVYLAHDNALGRDVVIKVLHPELAAGVNAERFKREVQLSARLQHPHIVPVLSAGEIDGLPYYVMPFVRGESLRARIASSAAGPIPIQETIEILADVAKSLGYAHGEGIVHRDIKPDNILLSGGSATVADFGIAKAISTARRDEGGESLTSLGTSLGTPAYMAPEQVAGDPDIDHRADLYSLGCVAYEMLCGEAPFANRSPQQAMAAHITEAPVPISERRRDVPPALAALIMRSLAKDPSARPQNAAEFLGLLAPSGAYQTPSVVSPRRTVFIAAGIVVIALLGAAGWKLFPRRAATSTAISVAVTPFEVLAPDLALWKEGMVDVLSRSLDGAGPLRTISPSVSIKKWQGPGDRETAKAFGGTVGAQLVVYGQLQSAGRDLVNARAWVVDAGRDAPPIVVEVRDSSSRIDRLSDSLSVKLLAAIGELRVIGAAKLGSLGSGSLPAIRSFLQGAQYFRRARWDSAAAAFRQAVVQDSSFGIAYMLLGQTAGWATGIGSEEEQVAWAHAGRLIRPGLSPRDSLVLTAIAHYQVKRTVDRAAENRKAFATIRVAADRYPTDPEVWYLLGDMRFHEDETATEREVLSLFDHAIAADSDFAPAYIHAIEISYRYGAAAARRYVDPFLARNPRDLQSDAIRLAAAIAGEPSAERRRAIGDTANLQTLMKSVQSLARLADSAESVIDVARRALPRIPAEQRRGTSMAVAELAAARGHANEAWKLDSGATAGLVGTLGALEIVPAARVAELVRPWMNKVNDAALMAAPALAAAGDTATLHRVVSTMQGMHSTDTTARQRAVLAYFASSFNGYYALARRDTAAATTIFAAISDTIFSAPFDQFTRARLISRTDPKKALDILGRIAQPGTLMSVVRQLERGRIAERTGDREQAVDAYAYVAAAWIHADKGPLSDGAAEARGALQRLDADGKVRASLVAQR